MYDCPSAAQYIYKYIPVNPGGVSQNRKLIFRYHVRAGTPGSPIAQMCMSRAEKQRSGTALYVTQTVVVNNAYQGAPVARLGRTGRREG